MTPPNAHNSQLACCSNAGFLFLGTLLRLAALQGHRSDAQAAKASGSWGGTDIAAAEQSASGHSLAHADGSLTATSSAASSYISRMDGIVLDSAPAPITPDIAARQVEWTADSGPAPTS